MIIKRVDPGSCAKIMGIVDASVGLLGGVLFALISMVGGSLAGGGTYFGGIGVAAIIVFPILYGFIGLIVGFIGALFYNWAAGRVGGLEIEVE